MSQAPAQIETQKLAEAYREFDRGLRVRQAKVGAVLSLVLMPAGVSLDYFVYPHLTWSILQARLLTDVFLIPCFAILFMAFGRRYVKFLGNLWAVPPTWAICWMIYASEGVISPYYAGLNLIIIGACLLLPYTLKDAIFFCTFVLLSYSAACVLNIFMPPHMAVHHAQFQFGTLFNNLYFLSLTGIICSTACFYSSRRRFEDFRLRHELDVSNKQLAESYEQLSQIDKLKSAFFANISHELRTPLTLIISPLEEVLRGAAALGDKAREALDTARQNALRLLKLISDLLDIVRLEEGRAKLQHDPINLAVFVPAMVDSIRHLATVKGLTLDMAEPEGPLVVRGDHAGLEKVVLNILTNAIKFTPKGGTIAVRCWQEQHSAMVEIEDSGIGIPQESLPHIFDRFHQVDGSSTRKYQGVGIGLALARDLVQQHGGRLAVRSQLGKGTAFRIELPLDAAGAATAVPDVKAADTTDAISEIYKAANRAVPLPTEAPVPLESTGSGAHLVLVVDDEPDMRRFLVSALAKDHTVIQAADGLAGLELARAKKPDLVLLDLMLPGMDGLDVCKALKSDAETKNIKVVLLTARVDEQSKLTALERGADDFLTKPFSTAELQTRLANLLRSGELEEQLRGRNVELETTIKKLQDTEVQLV
ncbi:MAG TPA: ATP-binding protein, partial [Tepidisphaeraceae bacterium]|nr:ATP-binding protein [Tepidisphaeraceae bacterium]